MKRERKPGIKTFDEGTNEADRRRLSSVMRRLISGGLLAAAIYPAACAPVEETVETDTLITRAEVYDELGVHISSSDFAYNVRCLLVIESHRAGDRLTKVVFDYDEKDRLKTRIDEAPGAGPVRLDYAYSDDGAVVNIRQSSEGQPVREMNNVFIKGVLVERNWGESRPNTIVYKLETAGDKIVRRTYLTGGALRSTETLTFGDGLLTDFEYRGRDAAVTRRFEYEGKKLVKESSFDDRGNKTSEIRYSYSPVKVLKSRAGTHHYLHLANLIAEVKGTGSK